MLSRTLASVVHTVSVVVPVYQGEKTLPGVVAEIAQYTQEQVSRGGHAYRVSEIVLVHDNGPDGSDATMRDLAASYPEVRTVWLSRNFGQHAATLAGMASAGGDWIATMDEDGQHDPAFLGELLDTAMEEQAVVVYARPANPPPHGPLRNASSRGAKWVVRQLAPSGISPSLFNSYRLVLGEIGRSVAAYAGANVYLDIALGWVANRAATCPVTLREEGERPSGYNWQRLFSHFWRLVLSSGTRGLRLVAVLGVLCGGLGFVLALYLIGARLVSSDIPSGWTSTTVAILLASGTILVALAIVSEYVGMAVNMAMGRPLYLIVGDGRNGPLGRAPDVSPRAGSQRHGAPELPPTVHDDRRRG